MWASDMLAKASAATVTGPNAAFSSVSIDTRTVMPGALFVALRGENFDGHSFVEQAVAAGALGVVVSQPVALPPHVTVITVADTLIALQQMGHAARMAFDGPVVAVTGSNGKTSTRQLIASVLRAHFGDAEVLSTDGNYNNHIGVPLTLLRLNTRHRAAVIETGMNHFGELTLLSRLVEPTIAVITNAGPAHLEGVGSMEGVAAAKGEIFAALRANGVAVLNADDYFFPYWQVVARDFNRVSFGLSSSAHVSGSYSPELSELLLRMTANETVTVKLPFPGEHNARNALSAFAVAQVLKVPVSVAKAGLERATNIGGRLAERKVSPLLTVIDDSYNANPASIRAALAVLQRASGQKILVLGDIAELGASSEVLHESLLRDIEASSIDSIFTLGPRTQRAAAQINGRTQSFSDIESLMSQLIPRVTRPTTLLAKGAHSMAMHRVIERLEAAQGKGH